MAQSLKINKESQNGMQDTLKQPMSQDFQSVPISNSIQVYAHNGDSFTSPQE